MSLWLSLPLSSWSQTTPPCVSCKTKPKSCELLDAFGKKFNTKTDLDYLSQFCNASWTDAQLLPVLKEINSWSSDTRQKAFITQFGTIDAFRNGIIATPNAVYGWAVFQTHDLTLLNVVSNWKTAYPNVFLFLGRLKDNSTQTPFLSTFGGKNVSLQVFQNLTTPELTRLGQIIDGGGELNLLMDLLANTDVPSLKNLLNLTLWTDDFIAKLRNKLPRPDAYPNFASDLLLWMNVTSPTTPPVLQDRVLNIAQQMLSAPANAPAIWRNALEHTNIPANPTPIISQSLARLGRSEFMLAAFGQGRTFESWFTPLMRTFTPFDGFTAYTHQVDQLYLQRVINPRTAKNIIADNLLLRRVTETIGTQNISYWRAIINDCKLSTGAPWTPNQKSELIDVFRANPGLPFITFEVRTSSDKIPTGCPITTLTEVRIYREDVYKTMPNGANQVTVIQMSRVNFIIN